ncbi:MAG TPA: hypothetical protein ACFYEK_01160 [Candidatus Wunengus sp. YC60]|uniref:hypothetical protein n=1 Tax=Candidatus Wunengus sp. YC60 TaxID=3367697 RepID=UPI004027F2EB
MKIIKISTGEVRHGFEFNDLTSEAREKVLAEQIDFEIDMLSGDKDSPYYYLAEQMEANQTPWFLGSEIYRKHRQDLIDTIESNAYLFDKSGDILPIQYTYKKHELVGVTFDGDKCEISEPC